MSISNCRMSDFGTNARGLAQAETELWALTKALPRTRARKTVRAMEARRKLLRARIVEIADILNGANMPGVVGEATYCYRPISEDVKERNRCCIECGNGPDDQVDVVEVEYVPLKVATLVCLSHDTWAQRQWLSQQG